ncbi:unnamed protein product [Lactuca saligna]|uniref:Uncharacterized protein n=1 Tax=Lactuca saligna TaxID=75948 RepID=A0AA36A4J1_LACSI|nr:unnamed protein product [Lactuca saligna]
MGEGVQNNETIVTSTLETSTIPTSTVETSTSLPPISSLKQAEKLAVHSKNFDSEIQKLQDVAMERDHILFDQVTKLRESVDLKVAKLKSEMSKESELDQAIELVFQLQTDAPHAVQVSQGGEKGFGGVGSSKDFEKGVVEKVRSTHILTLLPISLTTTFTITTIRAPTQGISINEGAGVFINNYYDYFAIMDIELALAAKKPSKAPQSLLKAKINIDKYEDGEIIHQPLGDVF